MAISGHQIGQALIDELGLPKHTIGFTLRCYTQERVTVECEYYPDAKGLAKALARYSLIRRPDGAVEAGHPAEAMGFDAWMRERTEAAHAAYMARHSGGGKRYGKAYCTITVDSCVMQKDMVEAVRKAIAVDMRNRDAND